MNWGNATQVGKNGKHKALATKRINMADFVNLDLRTLETRQKYQMKPVASKVHLTEVCSLYR